MQDSLQEMTIPTCYRRNSSGKSQKKNTVLRTSITHRKRKKNNTVLRTSITHRKRKKNTVLRTSITHRKRKKNNTVLRTLAGVKDRLQEMRRAVSILCVFVGQYSIFLLFFAPTNHHGRSEG